MADHAMERPLKLGDRAPNVVLDAINHGGKVSIDDFRGQSGVLVGLYRGLQCPFCRRHIAASAELASSLREKGIDSLTVVNTPIERARLYFRYHPMPGIITASDPDSVAHRAFGLPNLEFTEHEDQWPYKVSIPAIMAMRVDLPGELPEPMAPLDAAAFLNKSDGYEITPEDEKTDERSGGQLVGEFLLDRDGIVRWSFTEVEGGGANMFAIPKAEELMSAASRLH
jgi:peroxiredoxin